MTAENLPFGFAAVRTISGAKEPNYEIVDDGIPSGYATTIYSGQPVMISAAGNIEPASAGDRVIGIFNGCVFTPSNGRPQTQNWWPGGQTLQAGSTVRVYYYSDPNIVYQVQADGSLARSSIGAQADLSNGTDGSDTNGTSQATLSTTTANNAQFRILGLSKRIDNAWDDAFTVVDVQISEHQYVADRAAIA